MELTKLLSWLILLLKAEKIACLVKKMLLCALLLLPLCVCAKALLFKKASLKAVKKKLQKVMP